MKQNILTLSEIAINGFANIKIRCHPAFSRSVIRTTVRQLRTYRSLVGEISDLQSSLLSSLMNAGAIRKLKAMASRMLNALTYWIQSFQNATYRRYGQIPLKGF